jgi:hypothetical protein
MSENDNVSEIAQQRIKASSTGRFEKRRYRQTLRVASMSTARHWGRLGARLQVRSMKIAKLFHRKLMGARK